MNGESGTFEYDEDVEAGDEAAEADEAYLEADEADGGEDSEADEAYLEADEGSDEADESFVEADGEADEAFIEADGEADEGADEAVSASAQLRADRDRNRRAAWARRIAAGQRVEAQRAATTQRSITSRIQSVRPGGPAKVASVGSLRGAGVVTAILPNGRRSRMRIIPTVAPIAEVNRLKQVVQVNERRQAVATHRNSRAIASLAQAQASAVKQLTAQQVKSDKDLGKRIIEGHNRLDKRITKELSGGSGSLDKHGKRLMRHMKRQRQRSIMNNVLVASALPLFAAYGDRSKPWASRNLLLTGSLVGWMLGDELLDSYAGKSKGGRGVATAWSWGAPVGNFLTSYFPMRNKQHQRFLSGVTTFTPTSAAPKGTADVKALIGTSSFSTFSGAQHSAVGTVVSGADSVNVTFNTDKSQVEFEPVNTTSPAGPVTVAWIVDTDPPSVKP